MRTERIEALEALEREVNAELGHQATAERSKGLHKNWPITDGVVDESLFLANSPKMLWILKEAWEEGIEETGGGDWSVTKTLIPKKVKERSIGDRGLYAKMAWVTYAVLNGYQTWQQLPWASKDPEVGESFMNITILPRKFPGA